MKSKPSRQIVFCFLFFVISSTLLSCANNKKELSNLTQLERFDKRERLVKQKIEFIEVHGTIYVGDYFYSPYIAKEVSDKINLEIITGELENESVVWSDNEMCVVNYDQKRIEYPLAYICFNPKTRVYL